MEERIIKYFNQELSASERKKLIDEVKHNDVLKNDFIEYNNLLGLLALTRRLQDEKEGKENLKSFKRKHKNHSSRRLALRVINYAAIFILLLTTTWFMVNYLRNDTPTPVELAYNTLHVPIGQRANLTLSDGTEVWLNAGSSLKYPVNFNQTERKVSLSGEAYFTTGNHEYYIDTNRALELIEEAGLKILRNEMVETHGLQLIGLEYMNADRHTYDGHMVNDLTIEEELPKIIRDRHKPALVMNHSPVGLEYVIQGGADIMLSGHTHGGQLFPGTLLAWLRFPLLKGLYEIDGTRFLVSQGAGTFGPWMRAGTFNEIQFIRLVPEAGQALTD